MPKGTTSTFTAFPSAAYGPGTYYSGTASYNGAPSVVGYAINSSTWATDDPSIQVYVAAEQSFDGGVTWNTDHPNFAFTCHPANVLDMQGNPMTPAGSFECADGLGARLVRCQLTVTGGTLTLGITGSLTPLS